MFTSNSRTYFSCAQRNLQPPQVDASSGSISVRKDGRWPTQARHHPVKCSTWNTMWWRRRLHNIVMTA